MPPASCTVCGSRLPKKSRFCPECGARVGAGTGETAVQEIPEEETGRVPVELMTATPRFFGVTPPANGQESQSSTGGVRSPPVSGRRGSWACSGTPGP